jgi:hypothetical protein
MKRYFNLGENKYLKVELDYSLGGVNYFNSTRNERGLKVYFREVERSNANGYTTESFMVFGDNKAFQVHLLDMTRKSQKVIDKYGKIMQDMPKEKLMEVYEKKDFLTTLEAFGLGGN